MKLRRILVVCGLIILGIVLAFGFLEILEKRLQDGDIYPHYSSLRSDPLGTSALYESLEGVEGLSVRRNIKHLNQLGYLDSETCLLLVGYPRDEFPEIRAPKDSPVMKAVREGGRLVIAMNPRLVGRSFRPVRSQEEDDWFERRRKLRERKIREEQGAGEDSEDKSSTEVEEDQDDSELDEEEEEFEEAMSEALGPRLTAKLGFDIQDEVEEERPDSGWEVTPGESISTETLPKELPLWYSPYRFETSAKPWRTVLEVDEKPVVIERPFGKGAIVVASDSFFLSNEALHFGAEPGFLLWLLGGKTKIVFDETIHGTQETGGAMKLIRRYRLHGFLFGLMAFVALWAWRSASPLSPGSEALERGLIDGRGVVAGEDTGDGFINLLRRSVSSKALLRQCLSTWKTSTHTSLTGDQEKKIGEISTRHDSDPKKFGVVEAYRQVCETLRKR